MRTFYTKESAIEAAYVESLKRNRRVVFIYGPIKSNKGRDEYRVEGLSDIYDGMANKFSLQASQEDYGLYIYFNELYKVLEPWREDRDNDCGFWFDTPNGLRYGFTFEEVTDQSQKGWFVTTFSIEGSRAKFGINKESLELVCKALGYENAYATFNENKWIIPCEEKLYEDDYDS